ncbi:MAG: UvrB/UvrC motif-containing protein [Firmicutes bacterium]|nr:UvrB/UvrC motif-containing protein [Bacillota bacterium]
MSEFASYAFDGQNKEKLCDRCQVNPVSVHLTIVSAEGKTERYLCEECAQKEAALPFAGGLPPLSFQHLLGSLMASASAAVPPDDQKEEKVCPHCHMAYRTFIDTGRLGCDYCYQAFQGELEPVVHRLHGRGLHVGKIPVRSGQQLIQSRRLAVLREQLHQAVAQEKFEDAARLRDVIRTIEETGSFSKGGESCGG